MMEDVCWNIEDCFITFEEMDVLDPIFMFSPKSQF